MKRTFTNIPISFILLFCVTYCLPYNGAGQGIYSGADITASVINNRNVHAQIMPHGIDKSWYSEAIASIEEREYFIRTLEQPGVFGAVNHPQHLTYLFNTDGYAVSNFNDNGSRAPLWHNRFIISGIGRDGKYRRGVLQSVRQVGDMGLHYEYNDYAIDYSNMHKGMEQTFHIDQRVAGSHALEIGVKLDGDLQAKLSGQDQLLLFKDHRGDVKLVYDQVRAWDKKGKRLTTYIKITDAHGFLLCIDDSKAEYPITVDPLNHTPDATFALGSVVSPAIDETLTPIAGGYTLAGVGDVNGDGMDDIVIGAPLYTHITSGSSLTSGGTAVGAAFLFYGISHSAPSTTPSQVLQPTGLADGALFGFSISGGGNMDGDVLSDFFVGAPGDTAFNTIAGTQLHSGKAYGYRGATMGTDLLVIPVPSAIFELPAGTFISNNSLTGFSLAMAGDMSGDGQDEVVIGVPGFNAGTGRIYIFHGSGTSAMISDAKIIDGLSTGSLFGFSVSSAGDVNNDGNPDIVVGAPTSLLSAPTTMQGAAYVFHGNGANSISSAVDANGASGVNGTSLFGTGGALFGFSVSNAGDVDQDGVDDIIVGEPLALDHGAAAGLAFVYYGNNTATGIGSSATPTTLRSPRSATFMSGTTPLNLLFGFSVGTAGNAVGDGASDVIVGEPGTSSILNTSLNATFSTLGLSTAAPTRVFNGAAYIFDGHASTGIADNAAPFWRLQNSDPLTSADADFLGASVHYAGDVNADGFGDLLIGSPGGSLDLGTNLGNVPTSASLTVGSGLVASASAENSYLFLGFSASLPVTLLTFTGASVNGTAVLNWSTAQEQNSDHFDIERSSDGVNFTSIGAVAAANNSSLRTDYTYTDASPVLGTDYYRLRMADLDGTFLYSKVIALNFSASGATAVAAYPNPAHGRFNLVFKNMAPGRYRMGMLSVAGQEVMTRDIQVTNAVSQTEPITLPVLAAGSYWIRLIDEKNHSFLSRIEIR